MTINYQEDVMYGSRFTYNNVAIQTLMKMGVIGYNETPDDNLVNLVYDTMLDTAVQICESGRLGSFRTRHVKHDNELLMPWDHAIIDNATYGNMNVRLPERFISSACTRGQVRNLDCIKTSDTLMYKVMYLVFDGTIGKWQNINQPIFEIDEVPFAKLDREAYIADLYIKMAPYFNLDDSQISQTVTNAKQRFDLLLNTRANDLRNNPVDPLFGTEQDLYYSDYMYPPRSRIGSMFFDY